MTHILFTVIGLVWGISLAILAFIAIVEWRQHERKLRYRLDYIADRGVGSRRTVPVARTARSS